MLLAGNSEKMLKSNQAKIPENWKTTQGIIMSFFSDSQIGQALHQQELLAKDLKAIEKYLAKLKEVIRIIKLILEDDNITPESKREEYFNKLKSLKLDIPTPSFLNQED